MIFIYGIGIGEVELLPKFVRSSSDVRPNILRTHLLTSSSHALLGRRPLSHDLGLARLIL